MDNHFMNFMKFMNLWSPGVWTTQLVRSGTDFIDFINFMKFMNSWPPGVWTTQLMMIGHRFHRFHEFHEIHEFMTPRGYEPLSSWWSGIHFIDFINFMKFMNSWPPGGITIHRAPTSEISWNSRIHDPWGIGNTLTYLSHVMDSSRGGFGELLKNKIFYNGR